MKRLLWLIPFLLVTTLPACAKDQTPVATSTATSDSNPVTAGHNTNENDLSGTSWKLVKLQTGDETTLVPDDGSKYTITFGRDGRVTTRV